MNFFLYLKFKQLNKKNLILHSVPSQDSHTFNKNSINEKVHLLLIFVLLTLAAWILKGTSRLTGMHIACWLSVPLHRQYQPVAILDVGGILTCQNFRDPLLNQRHFGLIFKTQMKGIHHCQNGPPTSHSSQSLTILGLAFIFCSINS